MQAVSRINRALNGNSSEAGSCSLVTYQTMASAIASASHGEAFVSARRAPPANMPGSASSASAIRIGYS